MDSTLPEGEKGNIILSVLDGLTMKIIRRPTGGGLRFSSSGPCPDITSQHIAIAAMTSSVEEMTGPWRPLAVQARARRPRTAGADTRPTPGRAVIFRPLSPPCPRPEILRKWVTNRSEN